MKAFLAFATRQITNLADKLRLDKANQKYQLPYGIAICQLPISIGYHTLYHQNCGTGPVRPYRASHSNHGLFYCFGRLQF